MTIRSTARFPFDLSRLPEGDTQILLGSDLALWITTEGHPDNARALRVVAHAVNSDGEAFLETPLAVFPRDYRPDGATLTLLADLARRSAPGHARLDE